MLLPPLHPVQIHHQQISKTPNSSSRIVVALHSTAPTSIAVETDENISTSNNDNSNISTGKNEQLVMELGNTFAQKIFELENYKRENGHCLVPKRYPSLGNWVNKQRQNYRKFLKGEKSSMDEKRMSALNRIGFVWDATSVPLKSTHNDNAWQKMYNQLSRYHATNGHCRVPSSSPLGQWVVRQRFLYRQYPSGKAKSTLTDERINLFNELNFPWMTRSEQLWERRINELQEFKQQNGHVMVPMKYRPNPQLSAWVATQRKNYNRKQAGRMSPLSLKRISELEEMGFVWSYWDHNFMIDEKPFKYYR